MKGKSSGIETSSEIPEKLGSRVAALRSEADLTQLELSLKCEVTQTTIANWEKNRSGVEWFLRVARLCEALHCQPKDLLESSTTPLSSRVAALRSEAGLTQLELSLKCEVTQTTIANWEKNRSGVEWFLRVARLCEALHCQPKDLLQKIPPVSHLEPIALSGVEKDNYFNKHSGSGDKLQSSLLSDAGQKYS